MTTHDSRWNKTEFLLAFSLLALAAIIRFAALGDAPRGLFRDEWEKGYTALELWSTGRHAVPGGDGLEISRALPLFIEVYKGHDRTSAIYQYATAPVVGLFGLNAFTTRFAAAMAGWLTCVCIWLLARRAISWQAGIGALASAAFHPTGILFSRWAQQGSMAILFAVLGFWLLFETIADDRKQRRAIAAAAAMALGISAYAYDPARLVVPLIVTAFLVTQWPSIKRYRSALLPAAILFAAMWVPLLIFTLSAGSGRLSRVTGGLSIGTMLGNYFSHYSWSFWIIHGDANPRHNLGMFMLQQGMPGGFAGWATVGLIVVAATALLFRAAGQGGHKTRIGAFFFLWLFTGPMAAAATNEGIPHALRACLMIPASSLLAGYSVDWVAHAWKRTSLRYAVGILIVGDGVGAVFRLYVMSLSISAAWDTGLIDEIRKDVRDGKNVFLSAQIPYANYAALFAEETDPRKYHEENLAALRTHLVIDMPALTDGDVQILPPELGPAPFPSSVTAHIAVERRNGETLVRMGDDRMEF